MKPPTGNPEYRRRLMAVLLGMAYPTDTMVDYGEFRGPAVRIHESDLELLDQLIERSDWFANLDTSAAGADWPAVAGQLGDQTATDIHQAIEVAHHTMNTDPKGTTP